ncbi:hypothetical protein HF265_17980 [Rhizobium leguminosarum]|jgi:hypothetical protein|uniref:hypothetical protein n=1 Tax=Rhizobium leguminosarum TaxID=384 RepID=UPI001C923A30|nr:hypothetical protein [Rhizobium leguminosarum]MBY2921813.1 hypothetical protein [Rhizobium leguminosarum]MBY2961664.1 hypothetical protein [Rhizobium leguminosarum]MBY3030967.1 hypothetical protein [Rhizobium leguminosarum]
MTVRAGPRSLYDNLNREIPNPFPWAETAKILCRKHNSDLSVFDTAGTNLFEAIKHAFDLKEGSIDLNGNDIERFMLQRLCALTFSKVATVSGFQAGQSINPRLIEECFTRPALPPPLGLYMTYPPPHVQRPGGVHTEYTSLYNSLTRNPVGCRISFGPLSMVFFIEATENAMLPLYNYRPSGFRFWNGDKLIQEIRLHWENGAQSDFIGFDFDPSLYSSE